MMNMMPSSGRVEQRFRRPLGARVVRHCNGSVSSCGSSADSIPAAHAAQTSKRTSPSGVVVEVARGAGAASAELALTAAGVVYPTHELTACAPAALPLGEGRGGPCDGESSAAVHGRPRVYRLRLRGVAAGRCRGLFQYGDLHFRLAQTVGGGASELRGSPVNRHGCGSSTRRAGRRATARSLFAW